MSDEPKPQNPDADETDEDRKPSERSAHETSAPFEPHEDDDTALGDSDQHSTA